MGEPIEKGKELECSCSRGYLILIFYFDFFIYFSFYGYTHTYGPLVRETYVRSIQSNLTRVQLVRIMNMGKPVEKGEELECSCSCG